MFKVVWEHNRKNLKDTTMSWRSGWELLLFYITEVPSENVWRHKNDKLSSICKMWNFSNPVTLPGHDEDGAGHCSAVDSAFAIQASNGCLHQRCNVVKSKIFGNTALIYNYVLGNTYRHKWSMYVRT